jgi:hypothetical protein
MQLVTNLVVKLAGGHPMAQIARLAATAGDLDEPANRLDEAAFTTWFIATFLTRVGPGSTGTGSQNPGGRRVQYGLQKSLVRYLKAVYLAPSSISHTVQLLGGSSLLWGDDLRGEAGLLGIVAQAVADLAEAAHWGASEPQGGPLEAFVFEAGLPVAALLLEELQGTELRFQSRSPIQALTSALESLSSSPWAWRAGQLDWAYRAALAAPAHLAAHRFGEALAMQESPDRGTIGDAFREGYRHFQGGLARYLGLLSTVQLSGGGLSSLVHMLGSAPGLNAHQDGRWQDASSAARQERQRRRALRILFRVLASEDRVDRFQLGEVTSLLHVALTLTLIGR